MDVGGAWIPNVIDEIPMLAVLGTRMQKGIRIRDAAELRAKESDRIRAVAVNLRTLGAEVEEYPDGLMGSRKSDDCVAVRSIPSAIIGSRWPLRLRACSRKVR